MGVVSSAVAAMDAHRGVPAVAEHGLCFLRNLSVTDANKVCARCLSSMVGGQGGGLVCVGEGGGDGEGCVAWSASHAHDTVCCCVCVWLCDDVCPVRVWMLCRWR